MNKVNVKLKGLGVEVVVFTTESFALYKPIDSGRTVIELKVYTLPPHPVEAVKVYGKLYAKSRASSTLLHY